MTASLIVASTPVAVLGHATRRIVTARVPRLSIATAVGVVGGGASSGRAFGTTSKMVLEQYESDADGLANL